jgi:hypothetical protein
MGFHSKKGVVNLLLLNYALSIDMLWLMGLVPCCGCRMKLKEMKNLVH